jgi:hypothetical protein
MKRTSTGLGLLVCSFLLFALVGPAVAQTPGTQPPAASSAAPAASLAFDLADVHPSAHSKATYMCGAPPHGGRFRVHNATIVDLVSIAYTIDNNNNILSGPSWLDTDHIDEKPTDN